MLPNFLVIGAMKAGTTSLYEYLRSHPQVFMPDKKELDFFVSELNFDRGRTWYESQFDDAGNAAAIGEASTNYTKYPIFAGVPGRIANVVPDARLVYAIRHPIERMRSQYLHERLLGEERMPIERALVRHRRYRDFSNYGMQISQYLDHFPREQLLVICAEDLRGNRSAVLRRICRFLGIDENWRGPVVEREFHRTAEKRVPRSPLRGIIRSSVYVKISPFVPRPVKRFGRRFLTKGTDFSRAQFSDGLQERLEDMVRDDVRALRAYLGDEFHGWGIA